MENKKEVLVICPSRGRPEMCGEMIDSFMKTSRISSLTIALDNDDPRLYDYIDVFKGRVAYTIDIRKSTTEIINSKWRYCSDCYKYFSITNDDFIYHTDGWDEKLALMIRLHGGTGIAYGNDLLAKSILPTTSIISKEIVKAVGWLQIPTLCHLYGDNVWKHIGEQAGCLFYNDSVVIEHKHVFSGKMTADETHKESNARAMYVKDHNAFLEWLNNQSKEDIEKVKRLLCQK